MEGILRNTSLQRVTLFLLVTTPRSSIPTRDCQSTNTGSTNAGKRATDVTPIATSKLRLVVNEPREDSTLDSDTTSDSTDASESIPQGRDTHCRS